MPQVYNSKLTFFLHYSCTLSETAKKSGELCISEINFYIKYTHLTAIQIILPCRLVSTNAAKAL